MNISLFLSYEGVNALREFADAMPKVVENLTDDTAKLIAVYQSVADQVGPHNQEFLNMLLLIKSAVEKSEEAITILPEKLKNTADMIEIFLNSDTTPAHPVKKLTPRR